jgi:hypothetical protein
VASIIVADTDKSTHKITLKVDVLYHRAPPITKSLLSSAIRISTLLYGVNAVKSIDDRSRPKKVKTLAHNTG